MTFIAKSPSAARPSQKERGLRGVFVYPVARIPQKWAPVLRKEYAPFQRFEHFLAANRNATLPENARCADLALVYGKGCRLSPVRRVFWTFLALFPGRPEIRPPRFGQGLGLGLTPGRDPGMVAGQQDFGDRPAFEHLRTGVLRVFQ